MSDLETPQIDDLAAGLEALSRGLRVVPTLVDQVGSLDGRVDQTTRIARDISDLALAACEAELRSMHAMHQMIFAIRVMLVASPGSNEPNQALDDAQRELDAGLKRINAAMAQVMARSATAGSSP
jgi:hypothetical protein